MKIENKTKVCENTDVYTNLTHVDVKYLKIIFFIG